MDSCLVQLTDSISREMDKGIHTGMILADLQRVFDTLNHTVLLRKMQSISFKESVIKCSNDISVNANPISVSLKPKQQHINTVTFYLCDIFTPLVGVVCKHIDQI